MKKIIKYIICGLVGLCLSTSIKAQNYTITDEGDAIKFRGANAYSVSHINKNNISSINIISSSEIEIGLIAPVPTRIGPIKSFELDYNIWSNGQDDFGSVDSLDMWLNIIWNKRYYKTYTYDISDNLIQTKKYWIFSSDTVEVTTVGDTSVYSGSLIQTMAPNN